ncbi:MAG: hypothetical protein OQL06_04400 [Gammaproteobacteria bacterium]|nr:hypothetical protein [Gammaproteobacteria bacterium]
MLSTNQWLFIFLLQLILILGVVLVVGLVKYKNLKKHLSSRSADAENSAAHTAVPDFKSYLQTEIDRTGKRLEHLKQHAPSKDVSGLNLRLKVLTFELAYLAMFGGSDKSEDTINWDDVNLRIYKILKEQGIAGDASEKKRPLNNNLTEDNPSESLLAQQTKTIEHLKAFINDLLNQVSPESLPSNELDSHFRELERSKIELEQCVIILEDENSFLRDQIGALLKVQPDDAA